MRLTRPGRRWRWLALALALAGVGSGALAWLAASEPGLRFIARQAERMSGGNLRIAGVRGTLAGPFRIDALTLRDEEKRFELRDLRVDWSPRALWRRSLLISRLSAAELTITEIKPSDRPPRPPASLRLPLGLSVPSARLERLTFRNAGGAWAVSGIEFGLDKPADTYRLDLRALSTPWGEARAQASLAQTAPFALTGQGHFRHAHGNLALGAAGTLALIDLKASATLAAGWGKVDMRLAPFSERPLQALHLTAQGIDPSVWDKTLPGADLDLQAELSGQGVSGQGAQTFAGSLTLRNGHPGTWDRGRLPLKEASARLAGTGAGMDLQDIRLDLDRAGRFTGSGRIDAQGAALDLDTRDFDPAGLHGKLRPLRLAGAIHVRAARERQTLLADLGYQGYRLRLDAERHARVLRINEALLGSGGGSLGLYGTLGLDADHPFDLAGALSGFDPAAFGAYPSARVNASFSAAGRLSPEPEARLSFAIADSQLRKQPLAGAGNLRLAARRLWDSDVALRLGTNRLVLRGAFGLPGDRLSMLLRMDRPDLIHPALSGRIQADGDIAGGPAAPTGHLDIAAENLAWGDDYRLGKLRAKARLDPGQAGGLALDARLTRLDTPRLTLDRASVLAQGRRDRHSLSLTARNPDIDLDAELAGAWRGADGQPEWRGQIARLTNRGRYPLNLLAPAQLQLGADHVRLREARFTALGARIDARDADYRAGSFASQGEFTGLSIAAGKKWPDWPTRLGGDLVLGGNWNIDAGEHFNGNIAFARESGDLALSLPAQPETFLGLKHLSLTAAAKDDRLQAVLEADGTRLGRLRASGESRLSRQAGVWGIAANAPLQARADLALQSVAWAASLLGDRVERHAAAFDGKLTARISAGGTLAAPRLDGALSGEGFTLALPEQGLSLRDGGFQAELDDNALELKRLSLRGGDGFLTGQGRLALRDGHPNMRVTLKADKLQAVSRPDRLLVLSGDATLALEANTLRLDARLKADRGQVELVGEDAPSLSEDVVVLGRESAPPDKSAAYAIDMDLDLNLGDRFYLKGRGLDAQLGGAVKLVGRRGAPLRANGAIRVVKGAYAAYGQRLDIERGILSFQGPLDNPGLNIVALRKNQEVEAGVAISGTAQAPVVKLVSNPTVTDSEKLSWLVLGHGLGETGGKEFDALQLAAGALLGAGESVTLQQRIAQATGLEEVGLKGAGTLESTVVTLGKRLSSRAYLSYEQGLAGTESLVKINYTLSRRLSVRAQAGTTPALDLFYTFSFD